LQIHLLTFGSVCPGIVVQFAPEFSVYIPTIGIPQSINCQNSQKLIQRIEKKEIDSIHLIYDDMSIRDYWLDHLDWLNKRLEIQTIKKLEFNSWFQKF